MKKILLSFKPFWYEKIKSGEKIFEYRKRFCDEPVMAYMYVSSPVKAVTGIIMLDRRIALEDWKTQYKDDNETYIRICNSAERNTYAMPILKFIDTNEIPLEIIRKEVRGFSAPQMYYNLEEGSELLRFIERNLIANNCVIENQFDKDLRNEVCKNISG